MSKQKKLIILAADSNTKFLLEGLLPRIPTVEGLELFDYDIFIHPRHDSGIKKEAADFLRGYTTKYQHALVIFDFEGSGVDTKKTANPVFSSELAKQIEVSLVANGWDAERIKVICLDPELENWVWVKRQKIAELVDWEGVQNIDAWLENEGFEFNEFQKPIRPKEAFEALCKQAEIPRSSALYKELAEKASYKHCVDASFLELIEQLKIWFTVP